MKIKLFVLLLVIASLFSLALNSNNSKDETPRQMIPMEKPASSKEPMQPFVMADRTQFD